MVLILKETAAPRQVQELLKLLKQQGISTHLITSGNKDMIVLTGATSRINYDKLQTIESIAKIQLIPEPYKLVNRKISAKTTVISIEKTTIGAEDLTVIAGPCSVESEAQIVSAAKAVKKAGATMLRGGAYKPRTSPYDFQGLGKEGLRLLQLAKKETGLPVVCELTSLRHLEYYDSVDLIQIGARNMQNFEILREVGHCNKPILLKRGLSSTLEEWLMSAEYIMLGGNHNVILCERGIRTYETATRNTLDIAAIPLLKQKTHLPVLVDPSHAAGNPSLVEPLSAAAVAAGADGLMIEVHPVPQQALSDGDQSITPAAFCDVMKAISPIALLCGRSTRVVEHIS